MSFFNNSGGRKVYGEWQALTDEERTRHDLLFFSQAPIEGLMPGMFSDRNKTNFLSTTFTLF